MGRPTTALFAGQVAALLCLAADAGASREPLALPRLSGPIALDGRPDEGAWQAVAPVPLTLYAPTYKGVPAQRSEVRVAYDDEALYAAGWFYDREPGGIRVNSLYRDRWNGDDAFAIYVDAFDDNTTAKWFGTTPAAMRFDALVSQDGAGTNESWDGYWDARTTITDEGWFAEVRIPFSTLGFQAVDGRAVMGLTVTRLVSRTGERVTFPDIDPRFEFRAPSQAQDLFLDGVRTRTPIHLTPYALAGFTRRVERDPMDGSLQRFEEIKPEAGADLRYALSSTLTLDLTANTDFAQVEADEQQVALDRIRSASCACTARSSSAWRRSASCIATTTAAAQRCCAAAFGCAWRAAGGRSWSARWPSADRSWPPLGHAGAHGIFLPHAAAEHVAEVQVAAAPDQPGGRPASLRDPVTLGGQPDARAGRLSG